MVVFIKPQVPVTTSLRSLVQGFILTQRTDCRSPNTIEYYGGMIKRFLWYAEKQEWPDDTMVITEWHIREFLAYVSSDVNRWGVKGNGSQSSRKRATYSTVHHYYCVLKAFFNWCVRDDYISESPLIKIKLANAKANEAKRIDNLPAYIDSRLNRVITHLGRIGYVKDAIEAVRKAIPDGAIEEEQMNARHGTTSSLI